MEQNIYLTFIEGKPVTEADKRRQAPALASVRETDFLVYCAEQIKAKCPTAISENNIRLEAVLTMLPYSIVFRGDGDKVAQALADVFRDACNRNEEIFLAETIAGTNIRNSCVDSGTGELTREFTITVAGGGLYRYVIDNDIPIERCYSL